MLLNGSMLDVTSETGHFTSRSALTRVAVVTFYQRFTRQRRRAASQTTANTNIAASTGNQTAAVRPAAILNFHRCVFVKMDKI